MEGEPGTRFEDTVTVERVRFAAEDTGFGVVEADRDGDEIILVGLIGHLEAGERVAVGGVWQDDRRFGMQVKVESRPAARARGRRRRCAPTSSASVHVGPTRARAAARGARRRRARRRRRRPARGVQGAPGSTPARPGRRSRSWDALRSTRALHLLLAPHGLAWLVARIAKHYGPTAHRVVREQPYELTAMFGVGFQTADTIARAAGADLTIPPAPRPRSCTSSPRPSATAPPASRVDLATQKTSALVGSRPLTLDRVVVEDGFVYRPATAALEAELAERIAALLDSDPSLASRNARTSSTRRRARSWCRRRSSRPRSPTPSRTASRSSPAAPARARPRRSSCCAPPRTNAEASVLLVAPTGRAARRVSESTGLEASTVHSALGWIPGEGPQRTEEDPLRTDLLVVDETSMANLELLVTLLRAVGDETHVVLVGDADQLAPVGAGQAVRGARRLGPRTDRRAHPHLPPGGRAR